MKSSLIFGLTPMTQKALALNRCRCAPLGPCYNTCNMARFTFTSKKQEPETAPSSPSKQRLSKKIPRLWNRDDKITDESSTEAPNLSPVRVALSEDTFHGSETEIGIEISLDWDDDDEEEEIQQKLPAVLNFSLQMKKRTKVHRSQFSVSFPVLERDEESKPADPLRRGHRVPLWETDKQEGYKDVLALLKKHRVTDEIQAVNNELLRLNNEIEALEEDRHDLDRGKRTPKINLTKKVSERHWDIHEWLAVGECDIISDQERQHLEKRRGTCLTFYLHNRKAREAFMSTCGWEQGGRTSYLPEHKKSGIVSLDPSNCKAGGAAEKVRHVTIAGGRAHSDNAFFISRDRDKASTWGNLPPRLFQKMKRAGFDARHDLVYLSTGPEGCYYAEFRSGDCWWGNALKDDKDFQRIIQNWNVYRVAFGPIVNYSDDDGNTWITNSWIIVARDGRAAWKNLPSRLHQKLESRLADWPAPAEISLGSDDSFFVRYLDGTIDYCLPAEVANVCEYIARNGGQITDMALHPDVSEDFVIRHTEIKRR